MERLDWCLIVLLKRICDFRVGQSQIQLTVYCRSPFERAVLMLCDKIMSFQVAKHSLQCYILYYIIYNCLMTILSVFYPDWLMLNINSKNITSFNFIQS